VALTVAPDFTDGITTAAKLQQLSDAINERSKLYVLKTADESVTSSTAQQNDNELLLAVEANVTYIGALVVAATSAANAAGDINIGYTFPSGATLHFWSIGAHNALASGSQADLEAIVRLSATSGTTVTPYGLSTANINIVQPLLLTTSSTAGTLQMQWAQQSSNANASTVKAGSYMYLERVT